LKHSLIDQLVKLFLLIDQCFKAFVALRPYPSTLELEIELEFDQSKQSSVNLRFFFF